MHAMIAATARSDATLAALLLAHGLATEGPTLLVRVAPEGAPTLRDPLLASDALNIVQVVAPDDEAVEAAFAFPAVAGGHRNTVLDLPTAALFDPRVAALGERAMLCVGPNLLDEAAATTMLLDLAAGGRHAASALGCSRPGGDRAAALFARRMAWAVAGAGGVPGPVAPAVTPALTERRQDRLLRGLPDGRTKRLAVRFAAAIRGQATATAEADLHDTLRLLACDLADVEDDGVPASEDLADAPTLEDWRYEHRPRRVLVGRVRGHPTVPDGRRVVTSGLYASDGRTFGRTLNRFYALGRPAS